MNIIMATAPLDLHYSYLPSTLKQSALSINRILGACNDVTFKGQKVSLVLYANLCMKGGFVRQEVGASIIIVS